MFARNLKPYDRAKDEWRVIVETPKGSRNKYKFDEELAAFSLSGVLPEGMSFPYDFGFLPNTRGEDGDPLDVLILMDEPAFCGCVVQARLIGVIEARQTEPGKKPEKNDRLVAMATHCHNGRDVRSLKALDENRVNEIQEFFVSYNRVRGKKFKVTNIGGPSKAKSLARAGIGAARQSAKGK